MLILLWEIPKLTQQSNMYRKLILLCGALVGCIAVHAQDVIELQSGWPDDGSRANHCNVLTNAECDKCDVYVSSLPSLMAMADQSERQCR